MGQIKVTVQTEKRLAAITNLSIAVKELAIALGVGTYVAISNNTFSGGDPAVIVETTEVVTKTEVVEI